MHLLLRLLFFPLISVCKQSSIRAASKQHWRSIKEASKQHQGSIKAASKQLQSSIRTASKHHWRSIKAASKRRFFLEEDQSSSVHLHCGDAQSSHHPLVHRLIWVSLNSLITHSVIEGCNINSTQSGELRFLMDSSVAAGSELHRTGT